MWSRWANSAPMRPRLSQTPARIFSISSGDFSGKAAFRFSRPMRSSRRRLPMNSAALPKKFAVLSGSNRRVMRKSAIVMPPTAASLTGLTASRRRALRRRRSRRFIGRQRRQRLSRFPRQDQRRILPAETERVGHDRGDAGIARLVADHIERNRRGGILVIARRRDALMLQRQQREDRFHAASRRSGVADRRLARRDRNRRSVL